MTMSKDDLLKAALKMIKVAPENYETLKAEMILYLCKVIAEAENQIQSSPSIYDGLTKDQIKDRVGL
ncbi:MAG: hypothetical protein R6W88_16340 [Desulfobacterales bacterium]